MRSVKLDPPQTEYFEGSLQVYRMNRGAVGQSPITPYIRACSATLDGGADSSDCHLGSGKE
jgi:hypothetical protein